MRSGNLGRLFGALLSILIALSVPVGAARSQQPEGLEPARPMPGAELLPGSSPADHGKRAEPERPVLAGPIDPTAYVIGPGDVLSIEYGGRATGSTSLTVDSEGRVRVPSLGFMVVAGRTLAVVREELIRRLHPQFPGAIVDVRLLEPRTFKVYVVGEVEHPGAVTVLGTERVLDAINAAGGGKLTSSTRNIRVLRGDGRAVTADLELFRRTGDWDANPYIVDGDRVVVPIAMSRMGITGAVGKPGSYEYRAGDSLGTAIRLAGGLLPSALTDSVLVLRWHGASEVDTIYTSIGAADPPAGRALALAPDDRIYVRAEPLWRPARSVVLSGEVRYPGTYPIVEGSTRISEVVRSAGGFAPQASLRNVRIERVASPVMGGDPEYERLNRLSRGEMTNTEYQAYRSKLALRRSVYLVDFSRGWPLPPEADVVLSDGDRIEVDRTDPVVRVDGSVRHPGFIQFAPGRSAAEYVRLAGGVAGRGTFHDARVTRAGSSSTSFVRDIGQMEPGDFIFVPERKDVDAWGIVRDVVMVVSQGVTVWLLARQVNK